MQSFPYRQEGGLHRTNLSLQGIGCYKDILSALYLQGCRGVVQT